MLNVKKEFFARNAIFEILKFNLRGFSWSLLNFLSWNSNVKFSRSLALGIFVQKMIRDSILFALCSSILLTVQVYSLECYESDDSVSIINIKCIYEEGCQICPRADNPKNNDSSKKYFSLPSGPFCSYAIPLKLPQATKNQYINFRVT